MSHAAMPPPVHHSASTLPDPSRLSGLANASLPVLKRKPGFLEKASVWFFITCLGIAAIWVLGFAVDRADATGGPMRGYTARGLLAGILVVVLAAVAWAYSLRKRTLQEVLPRGRGSMMMWLWLHVAAGVMSVVAIIVHAGFGLLSPIWSTGKILAICFGIVLLSGVLWRLIYRVVPAAVAPKIGNYSKEDTQRRADDLLGEIEKLSAGRSELFKQLALSAATNGPQALNHPSVAQLPDEDRAALGAVQRLADSRARAGKRQKLQQKASRRLQVLRIIHVPFTLLIGPLLVVHVIGATQMPMTMFEPGEAPSEELSGFVTSEQCAPCHQQAYEEWQHSMHAHAMTSPVTWAQNNIFLRELPRGADDEVKKVCINCHGPVGTLLGEGEKLPLQRDGYSNKILNEGISCVTCHQHTKGVLAGNAGLERWQRYLVPGGTYFGPYDDAVGNAYHRSERIDLYETPENLCLGCHNVTYDKNGDGNIQKGEDLVLQTTDAEYEDWRRNGGTSSCPDCHMPVLKGTTDIADGARLVWEQDGFAPERKVHDHSFVGVDYPLDKPSDPHRSQREALLGRAAKLTLDDVDADDDELTFAVEIENVGAGHNLPSGFAFARQMWLEVVVKDRKDKKVFESGVLEKNTHDLCDAGTMDDDDNPVARYIKGCDESDPFLVNFQQKLVSEIEIVEEDGKPVKDDLGFNILKEGDDAEEVVIQGLDVGAVARTRPFDKQKITVIPPGETSTFKFKVEKDARGGEISVRLLFRNLPPYMLRGIAKKQKKGDGPKLDKFIKRLEVVEMEVTKQRIARK